MLEAPCVTEMIIIIGFAEVASTNVVFLCDRLKKELLIVILNVAYLAYLIGERNYLHLATTGLLGTSFIFIVILWYSGYCFKYEMEDVAVRLYMT